VRGDHTLRISGVAGSDTAGPEDLIYADSPRHADRAAKSGAACALVSPDVALPGKTLLVVSHPKLAFAKAAAWLLPGPHIAAGIHATAVIAPSARLAAEVAVGPYAVIEDAVEIGAGTQIGAFCFVGAKSRIGERCLLYPRVTLYAAARLGSRVILHSGVVIGSDGFGYVPGEGRQWKFPQVGGVEIGDDVEIGSNTTVDRGSLGTTRIESGAKLDNLVQVGHNVRIGENTVIAAMVGISGSTSVGRDVVMAGQVGIADHCTIGDRAVLAARTAVLTGKNVPAGQMVWGIPSRPYEKVREQVVWLARLPELAARVERLEKSREGK
jgi:UDP-3-O-[3-hydroxymyristoyl] glucosamine N-acyltransferase